MTSETPEDRSKLGELPHVDVFEVGPERAEDVLQLILRTFSGRPQIDPPSTALQETVESIRTELAADGGLLVMVNNELAGTLLFRTHDRLLGLRRVGVVPEVRHHGIAMELAAYAAHVAADRGHLGLVLEAREELPETVRFWQRQGYVEVDRVGPQLRMVRQLPVRFALPTAQSTRELGLRLARVLQAGDLLVLEGSLGAGKTTLTQGIGEGLGVRGAVTSPTFVISRVHPSLDPSGPVLVHVDAYRLGTGAELDDLDLDTDLDRAVTVVEWGEGLAEALSQDRLELRLERAPGGGAGAEGSEERSLSVTPVGLRWLGADLSVLLA